MNTDTRITKFRTDHATREVILGKGGPSALGWHKIESFLRCPKAFQLKEVRQIRVPQSKVPDHFAVGIMHHAMRAKWFALKFKSDDAAWLQLSRAAQEACEENALPISPDAEQRAMTLFRLYIEHWKVRPLPRPLVAEYLVGPASVFPEDPSTLIERTARLDDVSYYPEAGGKLCIGEAKTTSSSIADTVSTYQLHGQPMLQLLLWNVSEQGAKKYGPVEGIMLDVAVKPYERKKAAFERVFVPISKWALDWYAQSMRGYLRAASKVAWDTEVPRNVQGCTYLAGRMRVACEFRELCQHGQSASIKYVLGKEGKSLLDHRPEPGKMKRPWE